MEMEKVRIYFIEITDTNDVKHRLKTDKLHVYNNFIARHQGKINGLHMGSRLVNKDKLKEILGDGD